MRGLDLFSGIGLFSLGMEEAGIETVAACEIADWKRLIFHELCGEMPMWHDIKEMRGNEVVDRAGPIDIVFGSPPCTDASLANSNGKGVAGAETGLFLEAVRVIREIRPDWIALENVPGLRTRGADWVLTELEEAGYAIWPVVVGADNLGAPHIRKRVWIVGYTTQERPAEGQRGDLSVAEAVHGSHPDRQGQQRQPVNGEMAGQSGGADAPHDQINGRRAGRQGRSDTGGEGQPEQALQAVADHEGESRWSMDAAQRYWTELAGSHGNQLAALERDIGPAIHDWAGGLGRYLQLADGCPAKTARMLMSACGDGVVVEVAEVIGRAIMQTDRDLTP